jgi:glucose/arabinose dehydrogenase
LVAVLATGGQAPAAVPTDFDDVVVVGGFSTPAAIAFLPDGRLLLTEQLTARIRLVVNGAIASVDPVCTVPGVRNDNFYRGLLGIAVDPRWPVHPFVYAHYATATGMVSVSRFTVTGDLAFTGDGTLAIDPASRHQILSDIRDAAHNGGTLRFGPDQMLYVSVGDSFTVPCAAQRLESLRGVILRLEVRGLPGGPGGPPAKAAITPADNPFVSHPDPNARLVWARGLRNPFRFHVDAADGAVYIGDVGEDGWEEVDRVGTPGANFGWPLREGPDPYTSCPGALATGFVDPIHFYATATGQSVISAGIYRRPPAGTYRFPADYEGDCFFADYYNGTLRRLKGSGSSWAIAPPAPGQPAPETWASGLEQVSDFAAAGDGSLWYCLQARDYAPNSGEIRRIRYRGVVTVQPAIAPPFAFEAPFPSPARGAVRLGYVLASEARVELALFDLHGRRVRELEAGRLIAAGAQVSHWDGRDERGDEVPAGIYLARLRAGDRSMTRRVLLLLR